RQVVLALWNTGCRPGELAAAKGTDFNPELGAIVYYKDDTRLQGEHRSKVGGKKDRFIFFRGETLEMVKKLVARNPKGPIFRLHTAEAIRKAFTRIRARLKGKYPKLTAYSYRHSFATKWLEQNKSIETLSLIMGTSPEVIRRHYSHLMANYLRQAV